MKICEIFSSIEGEGIRAGYPCTFIRSVGCNLNCAWCDSQYSWQADEHAKDMSIPEIVEECSKLQNYKVTFTGGEPLIQPEALDLIKALIAKGFEVNVETNGATDISKFVEYRNSDMMASENLMFTIDYKCPSSGMEHKMLKENHLYANQNDVIKFVVGSQEDLETMRKWVNNHPYFYNHIFVSPVFGMIEPVEIVDFIKANNLQNVRLQFQIHKLVWPPEMRGV